jgi:autotransporter strand-loop-strand O-heptosyltransferase
MISYNINHINGLFFELTSDEGKNREYNVSFVDRKDGKVVYEVNMKPGAWAKLSRTYLSDIAIIVKYEKRVVKQVNILDYLKGKRVFIVFESSSLGDTLAWMPYCLEFQDVYQCEVIVSTFKNFLFKDVYPELTFVNRGEVVKNIHAQIELGWYWDEKKEPVHPATIPLQQAATNILCLPYREIIPRIAYTRGERPIESEYICISTRSTAQCKHWDYWPELIQFLKGLGYRVIEVSQEADDLGAETLEDKSLENVMNYLHHADFFIGLSSGISWLNWAMQKVTVMIANFTEADHEFQSKCVRITNPSVCNSCWNNPKFKFNKGDWKWCPEHEDTPRQFECHKQITVDMVINKMKENILI